MRYIIKLNQNENTNCQWLLGQQQRTEAVPGFRAADPRRKNRSITHPLGVQQAEVVNGVPT